MSFYSDQADQFETLEENIQARIDKAGPSMDQPTHQALDKQQDDLLHQAKAMYADDVQATLEGLDVDRTRLANCTDALNRAVKTVQTFNSIVCIAEAGLNLATACVSGNPEGILSALVGAEKAIADALPSNVIAMPAGIANSPLGEISDTVPALAASGDDQDSSGS
jgi:hypothetical protein